MNSSSSFVFIFPSLISKAYICVNNQTVVQHHSQELQKEQRGIVLKQDNESFKIIGSGFSNFDICTSTLTINGTDCDKMLTDTKNNFK